MLLEAHQICKDYDGLQACTDICLSLEEGQVFGLLGPNGAGKTTLVKIFLGLVYPSSGQAFIKGQPVGSSQARACIGYLPELFRLYEWLSAWEYLRLNARFYRLPVRGEGQAIARALEMVDLKGREREKIKVYSKGMQQRLALAAAILHNPPLIFLDEPTSALDPVGRREVRDLICRLQEAGTTLFINSHLLSEVEMTCTHLGFIKSGCLKATGPIGDFLRVNRDLIIEAAGLFPGISGHLHDLGWPSRFEGDRLLVKLNKRDDIPDIIGFLVAMGVRIYQVREASSTLEEIFIDLMEN